MTAGDKRIRRADPWRIPFGLAMLGMAATLLGYLGRVWWPLEWFSHFRVQFFACLFPFAVAFLWFHKFRMCVVTCVFLTANLVEILPLYFGGSGPEPSGEHLRVMLLNINSANRRHKLVIASIRAGNPDVVLVMEVNQRWMEALSELSADYPHRISRPRPDNFGIAFFSRLEPENLEIQHIASTVPSVVARLKTGTGLLTIFGTHSLPPINGRYARERNSQIGELARLARQIQGPVVLMGDLNTTSWSPFFADLVEDSGLRDSRRGFGIQASWPDGLFFLRIPIDHCLVSGDIAVMDRRVGPSIGSDHFPVTVDIALTVGE